MTMPPRKSTLYRLRADRRVECVDDEHGVGNGLIITLREGWSFDPLQDNRVAGEDTLTAARNKLTSARPYAGPYDP